MKLRGVRFEVGEPLTREMVEVVYELLQTIEALQGMRDLDAAVERMATALHEHDLAPGEPPCDMCRSRATAMLQAALAG